MRSTQWGSPFGTRRPPTRLVAASFSSGAAFSLVAVALLAAPAAASPGDSEDTTLEVEVEGTLLVVASDPVGPGYGVANPGQETALDQEDSVLLATDDGLLLPLEGIGEEVASGDQFVGSVLVPEEYFEGDGEGALPAETPQSSAHRGVDSASIGPDEAAESAQAAESGEAADVALEVAADSGVILQVGDFEIVASGLEAAGPGSRVAAGPAYARLQHDVDVVILNVAGKTSVTSSQALAALQRGTEFWEANAGEIIGWGAPPSPKTATVNEAIACDYASAWREALKVVGKPVTAYQNTGRHLAVYAPVDCMGQAGASGYGVIGQGGPHFGGMIWLAGNNGPITAHELGHNLSLLHADAVTCADGVSDVPRNQADWGKGNLRCTNREYQDQYDVMGFAYTLGPDWGTCGQFGLCSWGPGPLPALSIAHRDRLGIGEEQIRRVSADQGASQTLTIDGMGTAGPTKGLVITDPVSGERLYVEFRDGGGSEAGTVYQSGYGYWTAPGVKISREKSRAGSAYAGTVALSRSYLDASMYYFLKGDTFTSRTRAGSNPAITVTVADLSWGVDAKATLQVSFGASSNAVTERLGGADRYATSVAISQDTFPNTAGGTVFVATGGAFPDALAAAPAATAMDAPLLLVPSGGTLPSVVSAELARLKPKLVVVVGGSGAVSDGMVRQVSAATRSAPRVARLDGANRYETAAKVVNEVFPRDPTDDIFNWQYVFIVTGRDYPDALSASAAAGSVGAPVLLTNGTAQALEPQAKAILARMKPETVYIVGGTGAVSAPIEAEVRAMGYGVERLSGPDRYATSSAVAARVFAMDQTYPAVASHYWATGTNFPDALSGAAAAGRAPGPLYVIPPNCVPSAVLSQLEAKDTQVVKLLGGPGALTADVARMRPC